MSEGKKLQKISVACPHCGRTQSESAFAQSTICRACGEHFEVVRGKGTARHAAKVQAPAQQAEPEADAPKSKLDWRRLVGGPSERQIECFECGQKSRVSSSAHSATCPRCSSYVDLQDFKISGQFSRNIRTQGSLTVLPKGDFNSSKAMVASALIQGAMRGNIAAKGEVRVRRKGQVQGSVSAKRLVIERKSDVEFLRAIRVGDIEVEGKLRVGEIFASGTVRIGKHGWVQADVYARGFNVEKGGEFHGKLTIGEVKAKQMDLFQAAAEEEPVEKSPKPAGPGTPSS